MSLGGGSERTTTTAEVPAWYQQAQQNNIATARSIANRPYQAYGGPRVADWTPDQQQSFDMVRGQVGQSNSGFDAARDFINEGSAPVDASGYAAAMMGGPASVQATGYNAAQMGPAAAASTTTGADMMGAYIDPFTDQVVDRAMGDINRQEDRALSQARRRAAGAGSFGGSRTAIMENEIGRRFDDARMDTIAGLRSQGFNTALQAGMADAGRETGVSQFNAGAANDMARAQAGLDTSAASFGASAENQAAMANAGFAQEAAARDQDALNYASQFNSQMGFDGSVTDRSNAFRAGDAMMGLTDAQRAASQGDANAMFLMGERERGLRQQGMDLAYQDFNRQENYARDGLNLMINAVSGVPQGMFGQTTKSSPGASGQLDALGSAITTAAMLASFSDRRLKRDVMDLGGGLYEFAYVWDPATRVVGVMADEVPARYRITGMSGFDMVDYGLMMMEAA